MHYYDRYMHIIRYYGRDTHVELWEHIEGHQSQA